MDKNVSVYTTQSLKTARLLSLIVALLMGGASLAGLIFPEALYPAEEMRRSFVSNDLVNLCIGLPILLGSIGLAGRGRLIGLLFWPGALFFVVYNYAAYSAAMPLSGWAVLFLGLVILSVIAMIVTLKTFDRDAIHRRLEGKLPARLSGGVLIGLGALFFVRSIAEIAGMSSSAQAPAGPVFGTLVADLISTPVWVLGGVLLWRRRAWGYLSGAGLLFQASMLFVGLLIYFLLQPILAGVPFPAADFGVILGMSLVCFVPFGLFVRGILKSN